MGCLLLSAVFACTWVSADDPALKPLSPVVDATTLHHKVLVGYQGWFRCPGDAANVGWRHWSRRSRSGEARSGEARSMTVEMWPDVRELDADERYPAPGFTHADGSPAELFSSVNAKTVLRHFEWMKTAGIDGVLLQRFLVETREPGTQLVLDNVRTAAEKTGRTWALCYDLTGMPGDRIVATLTADWKRLTEEQKITQDPRYLHHRGKPVVYVFGFYSDRFPATIADQVIDLFHSESPVSVTLVGGCQWYWRREKDAGWQKVFRRFDVLSPWNVANYSREGDRRFAATGSWAEDMKNLKAVGVEYLPVIYPGFGWTNLKGESAAKDTIPRLKGEFLWRQFVTARESGVDMAYVAMFDEVDEGTAIFKVTNEPPREGRFQTYEGFPADWYLRLTGEGTRMLRKEIPLVREIPIRP